MVASRQEKVFQPKLQLGQHLTGASGSKIFTGETSLDPVYDTIKMQDINTASPFSDTTEDITMCIGLARSNSVFVDGCTSS